mgnify:CR=1 FL=1
MQSKLFAAALLAASVSAQAAPVIADSATFTGDVITFNEFDGLTVGSSLELGHGVTLTTTANAIVGQFAQDLGDNGLWSSVGNANRDGNFLASAFTNNRGEIGFSFANPVSSVGAFVNQFQNTGKTNNSLLVVAYDIDGYVLESFSVHIDTDAFGYDEGKFLGFKRATADIYGFGFVDGSVVIDNVVTATSAVPEPGTWGLMMAGLGVAGFVARRRRA